MFAFVLGFLSELARETGDWLDRILPAPRARRPLRAWRRRRPFWAALWVIAGGVEMVAIPLAPLPLMIRVGVGAMSAVGISVVLVAGGIFFLFKPDQRMFVSVVTAVASLTSMATTNLGGFGIGMLATSSAPPWPSAGCRGTGTPRKTPEIHQQVKAPPPRGPRTRQPVRSGPPGPWPPDTERAGTERAGTAAARKPMRAEPGTADTGPVSGARSSSS